MHIANFLAAFVALAPAIVASANSVDRDVITAALNDFVRRSDAGFYDPAGKLLIWPKTEKQIVGFDQLGPFQGDCPIDPPLYESLIRKNQSQRSAVGLVEPSPEWRFVRNDEEKTIAPQHPPRPGAKKGEPLKTVVGLYHPAVSDAGDKAVVTLHFAWSIHSASARYLLERSGAEWRVTCSKLRFYP
jgi:hypothetical protein